jgi:hypothetical protein
MAKKDEVLMEDSWAESRKLKPKKKAKKDE